MKRRSIASEAYRSDQPDVVLGCAGVYPTAEAVMAARLLSRDLPSLRLRLVNVTDLLILELDSFHPHGLNEQRFVDYFGVDCPVIFNFHGYPSAIKQLLWNRPQHHRFRINGYREEGTTTTPLTLLAVNQIDRFSLLDQILNAVSERRDDLDRDISDLRAKYSDQRQALTHSPNGRCNEHPVFQSRQRHASVSSI